MQGQSGQQVFGEPLEIPNQARGENKGTRLGTRPVAEPAESAIYFSCPGGLGGHLWDDKRWRSPLEEPAGGNPSKPLSAF